MFKARLYRKLVKNDSLVTFEVIEKETDLSISALKNLENHARQSVLNYRSDLQRYINRNPDFFVSLEPITVEGDAPEIVRVMADAAFKANVGPMASVAGAIAEFVGRDLLTYSEEIIVENGGDIFLKSSKHKTFGIYAGEDSPFSNKLAIEIGPYERGVGVCTSSGTVSHSLSFGRSDAVVIISEDAALADAAATAAGNVLKEPGLIEETIDMARSISGVIGIVAIAGDKMGSWGRVKLV